MTLGCVVPCVRVGVRSLRDVTEVGDQPWLQNPYAEKSPHPKYSGLKLMCENPDFCDCSVFMQVQIIQL